jgi:hypothetical protein
LGIVNPAFRLGLKATPDKSLKSGVYPEQALRVEGAGTIRFHMNFFLGVSFQYAIELGWVAAFKVGSAYP